MQGTEASRCRHVLAVEVGVVLVGDSTAGGLDLLRLCRHSE